MGSKGSVGFTYYVALVLSLNLLSVSMVSSQNAPSCNPLGLSACASVLGLVNVTVGSLPPSSSSSSPCCSILQGLGVQAGVCLCTAIRANVFGLNLNIPLSFDLIINQCGLSDPGSDPRCQ